MYNNQPWTMRTVFLDWFHDFISEIRKYLASKELPFKVLFFFGGGVVVIPIVTQNPMSSGPKAPMWSAAAAAESLQSCLTLCDPIDGSPPGYPVPGILQARTLEWVAISFCNA